MFGRSGAKSLIWVGGVGLKRLYRLRSIAFVGKISAVPVGFCGVFCAGATGATAIMRMMLRKCFMRLGVSFDNPRVSSGFDFQRQRKEIAKPYELQAELGIVQMAR